MQNEIEPFRKRINEIDDQLLHLLNERAEVALQIGKIKSKAGAKVYDATREGVVLERVVACNQGPLDKGAIEEIFATIMGACRQIQLR